MIFPARGVIFIHLYVYIMTSNLNILNWWFGQTVWRWLELIINLWDFSSRKKNLRVWNKNSEEPKKTSTYLLVFLKRLLVILLSDHHREVNSWSRIRGLKSDFPRHNSSTNIGGLQPPCYEASIVLVFLSCFFGCLKKIFRSLKLHGWRKRKDIIHVYM